MAEAALPKAKIGSIGGSGTWGARFPEDVQRSEVKVLEYVDRETARLIENFRRHGLKPR